MVDPGPTGRRRLRTAFRASHQGRHVTVRQLLTRLGLQDRVQAVVLAYESGLVTPGTT